MKKFLCFIGWVCIIGAAFADTETVTWYVDDTVYDTTTCESGDDVILPTPPTRYGYTFQGWESFFDISTLDTTINGQVMYSRNGGNGCHTMYVSDTSVRSSNCSLTEFSDLERGQFKVVFAYGTIYGAVLCSSTQGVFGAAGIPDQTRSGYYTWARIIKFVNSQDGEVYEQPDLPWVYVNNDTYCSQGNAVNSGIQIMGTELFRTVAYGL